jgi:hypothetical protein
MSYALRVVSAVMIAPVRPRAAPQRPELGLGPEQVARMSRDAGSRLLQPLHPGLRFAYPGYAPAHPASLLRSTIRSTSLITWLSSKSFGV